MNQDNGALKDCVATGGNLSDPIGITISGDYAYITNNKKWSTSGTITMCQIEKTTGVLSNCKETQMVLYLITLQPLLIEMVMYMLRIITVVLLNVLLILKQVH